MDGYKRFCFSTAAFLVADRGSPTLSPFQRLGFKVLAINMRMSVDHSVKLFILPKPQSQLPKGNWALPHVRLKSKSFDPSKKEVPTRDSQLKQFSLHESASVRRLR